MVGVIDFYKEIEEWELSGKPFPGNWHELNICTNLETALDDLQPDLVTVVTPPDRKTSVELIEEIANKGYDVLLEKLRPADPKDGEKLLKLSESSGSHIWIGECCRFDKDVESIKSALDNQLLGNIEEVIWSCHRPVIKAGWMEAYKHVMLEDLTYHHLAVIQYLFDFQYSHVYARSHFAVLESAESGKPIFHPEAMR